MNQALFGNILDKERLAHGLLVFDGNAPTWGYFFGISIFFPIDDQKCWRQVATAIC